MICYFKRYIGFAKCSMETAMAYRSRFFMNLIASVVEICISVFLWRIIYMEQQYIKGYDWNQMILYALIASVINATLTIGLEADLGKKILDGSITSDLTKPLDFQSMCLFKVIGEASVGSIMTLVMNALLALIMTDLKEYLVPGRIVMFACSVVLAFGVNFCLVYIGILMCFFTSNGYGVVYLRRVITDIFSGALLPLAFYPEWFQKLAGMLPFQSSLYLPIQIFLGKMNSREMLFSLAVQLFWVVMLWWSGRHFFLFCIRKITIHGG